MLIDAHAHLDRYGDELESALAEIAKHRIFTISTSMDLPSYERTLEIAKQCKFVLPAFGVHPWNAPAYADRLDELDDAAARSPVLGEIGLDYFFVDDPSQFPAQRKVFEYFLSAAAEQKKIVNLHTKGAEEEVLHLLDRYEIVRAIVHWYSGPLDVFREWVGRGTYFTIGVELLYSEHIQNIARELPMDQLLTETDNPGGPKGLTGTLGMPVLLKQVVRGLAELRGTTVESVIQTVHDNFARLIAPDPWLSKTCTRFFKVHGV